MQAERCPTQPNRVDEFTVRVLYVLNHVRFAGRAKRLTSRPNQVRMLPAPNALCVAPELARRASHDHIELVAMLTNELDRVGLVELERVTRLRAYINAHNLKPCFRVSGGRAPLAAVRVKQPQREGRCCGEPNWFSVIARA